MTHARISSVPALLFSFVVLSGVTGCVTASSYHKLEAEDAKNKEQLATSEARVTELENKIGVVSTQRTQLEGSVSEMKSALEDLRKRKAEAEKRLAEYREVTSKFSALVNSGKLSVKVVNGRMTVALSSDILFPSGSSQLSAAGRTQINEVTGVLQSLEGRKYQIEGHTDNVPIKTARFPSNWELASARAVNVLNTMISAGMPAERLSAASYADTQPISSNSTPEEKAANRRIAIVIVPDLSTLPGYDELNRLSTTPAAQ